MTSHGGVEVKRATMVDVIRQEMDIWTDPAWGGVPFMVIAGVDVDDVRGIRNVPACHGEYAVYDEDSLRWVKRWTADLQAAQLALAGKPERVLLARVVSDVWVVPR